MTSLNPVEAGIIESPDGEHQCNDLCCADAGFGTDFLMSRRAIAGLTQTMVKQVDNPNALIDALLIEAGELMQQQGWDRGMAEASLEILLYSKQWPK